MQHVDSNVVKYFETLNSTQRLYMDSMGIAPDPLASSAHEGEMRVQLRTEFSNWASPQHTMLVHTLQQCVKTFVFLPGEQAVRIPCSTTRPTSVEMLCYNDRQELTDKQALIPEAHLGLPLLGGILILVLHYPEAILPRVRTVVVFDVLSGKIKWHTHLDLTTDETRVMRLSTSVHFVIYQIRFIKFMLLFFYIKFIL